MCGNHGFSRFVFLWTRSLRSARLLEAEETMGSGRYHVRNREAPAQYVADNGGRGARLVSQRRFGFVQWSRSLYRRDVVEVRYAGNNSRELWRRRDVDLVSQWHPVQEGILHSTHGKKSHGRAGGTRGIGF